MMLGSLSKENELGQVLTACALKKDGGRKKNQKATICSRNCLGGTTQTQQ